MRQPQSQGINEILLNFLLTSDNGKTQFIVLLNEIILCQIRNLFLNHTDDLLALKKKTIFFSLELITAIFVTIFYKLEMTTFSCK